MSFSILIQHVKPAGKMLIVPDDHPTIQEAIHNAIDGDTIFVKAGTYHEHIIVNKTLTLEGENAKNTIIDGDESGTVIKLDASDTRISGFTITGTGFASGEFRFGIYIIGSRNNITNNNITNNRGGALRIESNNNTLDSNDITNNWGGCDLNNAWGNILSWNNLTDNQDGVYLYKSSENLISNNLISGNTNGITILESDDNKVISNNVTNNLQGISILTSSHNTLRNNMFDENVYGLEVSWFMYANNAISYFAQDIDTSNTVNHKSIVYLVNHHDEEVHPDAGYVALVNCTNIKVRNLELSRNSQGMILAGSDNCLLINLTISHNDHGLYLFDSSDNHVYGCNISYNRVGIALEYSYRNNLDFNTVIQTHEGIVLSSSRDNNITHNNIAKNKYRGVFIGLSSGNDVAFNEVTENGGAGIEISSDGKGTLEHNIIHHNKLFNNTAGVRLGDTSGNKVYSNNFINNTGQALDTVSIGSIGYGNAWDDGFPSGGNYWSDYNGTDSDQDGIGDTAYVIDANNTDNYPLMGMFYGFAIMWQEKTYAVNIISNSTVSGIGYVIQTSFQWPNHTIIEDSFESIYFYVSGEDGAYGFCRVYIPVDLLKTTYKVLVNGTEVPYSLLPCSNSTDSYLYFTYPHSTERVEITPEFPSFLILPLFMLATLLSVIVYRRKRSSNVN
jgi:parallel beta-helix repeat protein